MVLDGVRSGRIQKHRPATIPGLARPSAAGRPWRADLSRLATSERRAISEGFALSGTGHGPVGGAITPSSALLGGCFPLKVSHAAGRQS